jgi:hypothetical protein
MYLPVILLDRFGWPGFIAFALPNLLGCAAFGLIVRTPRRSRAMVADHAPAMTLFSIVTVAFHVFFWTWLFSDLLLLERTGAPTPIALAAALFVAAVAISFGRDRPWLALALVSFAVSCAAFAVTGVRPLGLFAWSGHDPPRELAWLVPAIAFGFLLCPFLDLTFHRALRESGTSRTFLVFPVAFAVMILLTCALWPRIDEPLVLRFGLAHLVAQSVFTAGAHLREIARSPAIRGRWRTAAAMALPLAALPLLPAARAALDVIEPGEAVYLRVLVLYALVFPAYVLVFVAARQRAPAPGRLAAWAVIVAALLPLYELGFMHHRPWLLPAALAVIGALAMALRRD